MSNLLTYQEQLVLELMNDGYYAMKSPDAEGLGMHDRIDRLMPSGTIKNLLEQEYIRQSTVENKVAKYVLTNKSRGYKIIKP